MKILFATLLVLTSSVFAKTAGPSKKIPISATELKFTYWNNEGDMQIKCTHKISNEMSQDWDVECAQGNFKRSYSVHLWATVYQRRQVPEQTIEILYWVSDRTDAKESKNTGTSFWLNTDGRAPFHSLTVSQAVDNDTASLYLDIKPGN